MDHIDDYARLSLVLISLGLSTKNTVILLVRIFFLLLRDERMRHKETVIRK
jgi:hypothetical protein